MTADSIERCRRIANSCYNEGLRYARERELSAAVPYLKRALLFDKKHIDARNLLGLIFFEMGEVGDALVQWVISSGIRAEDNPAVRYLEDLRRKKGKLRAYGRMIERFNVALAAAKSGSSDLAIHQLSTLVSEYPNYVRAGVLLGLLSLKAQEYSRAEYWLVRVLKTDRNNPEAVRYLNAAREAKAAIEKTQEKKENRKDDREKQTLSHRQMTDDEVIIPSTYHENTGWMTILNLIMGILIGAAAVIFLYMPTRTAEMNEQKNKELALVNDRLFSANAECDILRKDKEALKEEKDDLENQLNTIDESYTYRLSQFQKLLGIVDAYRQEQYSTAADLYSTIDATQLTDVDDDSGVSVSGIYSGISGKMKDEGYVILYQQGQRLFEDGWWEKAAACYDKALAINPDYEPALYQKALCYKYLGDLANANSLFGEVIMRFPDTELADEAKRQRGY